MPPVPACKLLVPVMTIARIKAAPQTGSSDTASLSVLLKTRYFKGRTGIMTACAIKFLLRRIPRIIVLKCSVDSALICTPGIRRGLMDS